VILQTVVIMSLFYVVFVPIYVLLGNHEEGRFLLDLGAQDTLLLEWTL
jgi:hypothetical protein